MTEQRTPAPRGRKPLPPEERRVAVRCFLSPAAVARLESFRRDGEPIGLTVERIIYAHDPERTYDAR